MYPQMIKDYIDQSIDEDGMIDSGIKGVKFFKISHPILCSPAIYEPSIVAIVSGAKEAILNGKRYVYDSNKYMCCSMAMPLETGTPTASSDNPLLGIYISLDTQIMTQLVLELESVIRGIDKTLVEAVPVGFALSDWDNGFSEALLRLLQLMDHPDDMAILANGRMRELYYTVLKGQAGVSIRRTLGVDNDIAKVIEYLSSQLHSTVTIDDIVSQASMSRAVLHRKFKQATSMSPIQFVKSMRLNTAAVRLAGGENVSIVAMDVGYESASQFSREFKRMFGVSPKQWRRSHTLPENLTVRHTTQITY